MGRTFRAIRSVCDRYVVVKERVEPCLSSIHRDRVAVKPSIVANTVGATMPYKYNRPETGMQLSEAHRM